MAKQLRSQEVKDNGPDGQELLDQVVTLSGLPKDLIQDELREILGNAGHDAQKVTLEDLREALAAHLELVNQDIISKSSDFEDSVQNSGQNDQ